MEWMAEAGGSVVRPSQLASRKFSSSHLVAVSPSMRLAGSRCLGETPTGLVAARMGISPPLP